MTTRTLGALMEADSESENSNPLNEIEQQLINDLQDQWKEPATRGDLRNHAVRMDSRLTKIDARFDILENKIDSSSQNRTRTSKNTSTRWDGSLLASPSAQRSYQ